MDRPTHRWRLLGTSTNDHGVTHFTLTCDDRPPDEDYAELVRVLVAEFGAVADGKLAGPYSVHRYMVVAGLRFGVILDEPEWLDLYATCEPEKGAMALFVARLLDALNRGGVSTEDPARPNGAEPGATPDTAR